MKHSHLAALATATLCLPLSGCIDDNYDLTDIDTTTEIKVNNLVLPVNIDPVELSDIIKVEEGDKLHEVTINGKTFYAVEESGTFKSDPINIDGFQANPGELHPTSALFRPGTPAGLRGRRREAAGEIKYILDNKVVRDLKYEATGIDKAIHSIDAIDFNNLSFNIHLKMSGSTPGYDSRITDVVIAFPAGMDVIAASAPGYTFSPEDYSVRDGRLKLSTVNLDSNGEARISVVSNAVDLDPAKYPIYKDAFSYANHTFHLDSDITIHEGNLIFTANSGSAPALPQEIKFDITYAADPINVTAFLGSVQYDIDGDGLNIEPITLGDLPDFLAGEETNLIISNPEIWLSINNPVGNEGLVYTTGFDIQAVRESQPSASFPLSPFTVAASGGKGPYSFLLAPKPDDVADIPNGFAQNLSRVTYPNLGRVLSGNGLPKQIDINLVEPQIPLQKLHRKFALGRDLDPVEGNYRFLAPLALEGNSSEGSVIVYTKREDGWNDEDVDAIVISHLSLSTKISSDLPVGAELTVYPLGTDGHRMDVKGTATIPANASDTELVIAIDGEIRHLDGVEFIATVRPDGSDEVLAPNQRIVLKEIQAKVTGTYTKKL